MNVLEDLQGRLRTALEGLAADPAPYVAMLKPAVGGRFGDYQANCAMALAKVLGKPPREVAQTLVERLPLGDLLEAPDISGPGFINLKLRTDWLARQAQAMARDERLGVAPAAAPSTFIVDFSSPNVAKPMHVGHLRSTIIGDALARTLRFLGHGVITDNHLGDWGTQFGILVYGYKHFRDEEALKKDPVRELARLYVHVRGLFKKRDDEDAEDADDPVQEACRQETARLHAGDGENLRLWRMFMPWCYEEIGHIYERLGVHFDHTLGESFYQPMLADVVASLEAKGLAQVSDGAVVVFLSEDEPPAMIRKRDGAYTYTTSDLATIQYRLEKWHPDTILYVVDFRQALHFRNLFAVARRWGCDKVRLEHISFGSVLGKDSRPLKTREGGVPDLEGLLDQAVATAARVYEENRQRRLERGEEVPELSPTALCQVHEVVGIGAVKYADLAQNRTSDYQFDLDKMTRMDGNTATYMQYAYVRNRGILRKAGASDESVRQNAPLPSLDQPEERALALQMVRFEEALAAAAAERMPSAITAYLFGDLAKTYSTFYNACQVLRAATEELRQSRLVLCDLTARLIQRGLEVLGIRTVERM
jgi:arginyl-tRNA synthetase